MFETLKGRIPKSIDEDEYRKFAVMVALLKQEDGLQNIGGTDIFVYATGRLEEHPHQCCGGEGHHHHLSLIHISEPTRH